MLQKLLGFLSKIFLKELLDRFFAWVKEKLAQRKINQEAKKKDREAKQKIYEKTQKLKALVELAKKRSLTNEEKDEYEVLVRSLRKYRSVDRV